MLQHLNPQFHVITHTRYVLPGQHLLPIVCRFKQRD